MRTRVPSPRVSSSATARRWTSGAADTDPALRGRGLRAAARLSASRFDTPATAISRAKLHRHPLEAGTLGSPEPPLARDQLVTGAGRSHDERLQDTVSPDRVGERRKRLLVEVTPGLVGVGHDVLHRHQALAGGWGRRRRRREQGLKALAQRLPHAAPPFVYLVDPKARGRGRGTPTPRARRDRRAARAPRGSGSPTAGRCAG